VVPLGQPVNNTTHGVNAQMPMKKLHEVITTIISTTPQTLPPIYFCQTSTDLLDKKQPAGQGEPLRTTSLNLENSRRPWLTEFHDAKPQTTVGVLTVSLFAPAIAAKEVNNFSLGLRTVTHSRLHIEQASKSLHVTHVQPPKGIIDPSSARSLVVLGESGTVATARSHFVF